MGPPDHVNVLGARSAKRKSTHNEVERRRRSRINDSMKNLAALVPYNFNSPGGTSSQNLCKSNLLERAVDYIKELQNRVSLDDRSHLDSKFDASLYKEIIELRIQNEEMKRHLTRTRTTSQVSSCNKCDAQLICLKCSGLLTQCLAVPSYSPTIEADESSQTSVIGMKTLPIAPSTNISPTTLISTSSLGAILSPPSSRPFTSPTMVHVDESTISFSNGIGNIIDLNCSLPECTLSDASNEVEMINRNSIGNESTNS